MKKNILFVTKEKTTLLPLGLKFHNMFVLRNTNIYGEKEKTLVNIFDKWETYPYIKNKENFIEMKFSSREEKIDFICKNEPWERKELVKHFLNKKITDIPIGKLEMMGM